MRNGTPASGRIYSPPRPKMNRWVYREIFSVDDVSKIESIVGTKLAITNKLGQKKREPGKQLANALNEAAQAYFRYAGNREEGTPSDFAKWSRRVSDAAAALLRALGVDPTKPAPISSAAFKALCERPHECLTAGDYGKVNYPLALEQISNGTAFIHDLGARAADYHSDRKVRQRGDRAKRGLSARQEFLLALARAYEAYFEKAVPKIVNPNAAPFVRFAIWACATVARRTVKPAVHMSDVPGLRRFFDRMERAKAKMDSETGWTEADDDIVYAAAAELGKTRGEQISDDMRRRVYNRLRAALPAA